MRKRTDKKDEKKEIKPKKTTEVTGSKKSKKGELVSKIKGILSSMEDEVTRVVKPQKAPIKKTEVKKIAVEDKKTSTEPVKLVKQEEYKVPDKYSELPAGYNDTKIVVMVRDPYWIYAYWEVNQDKIEEIKRMVGISWDHSKTILRIYDVTDIIFDGSNAHRYFDIELIGFVNNWYINTGAPDRSYCVDIGVLTPDNRFYLVARSNVVTTPRDTVSDILDEEWLISEEEMSMLYVSGKVSPGTSEELGKWIKKGLREEVSSAFKLK